MVFEHEEMPCNNKWHEMNPHVSGYTIYKVTNYAVPRVMAPLLNICHGKPKFVPALIQFSSLGQCPGQLDSV